MEVTDRNFEKVKKDAEEYYAKVTSVECPYFQEKVTFNSKGLKHIKFKSDRRARSREDQYMRLKHIRFAQRILEKSKTLQEYSEGKALEQVKSNNKKEKVLKEAIYYSFIAIIIDNGRMKRLKIVVKQVGGGERYFWSIIPFWSRNKELKMYSGNLEED